MGDPLGVAASGDDDNLGSFGKSVGIVSVLDCRVGSFGKSVGIISVLDVKVGKPRGLRDGPPKRTLDVDALSVKPIVGGFRLMHHVFVEFTGQ